MITIVDYGVGNIQTLINIYDYLGFDAISSYDSNVIAESTQLILPGVGSFDRAMFSLQESNLLPALEYAVQVRQVPVLGICLGMQLMTRGSEEGKLPGLGWIDADVKRINISANSELRVPHIGWTEVRPSKLSSLFPDEEVKYFYFVHGYHVVCDHVQNVLATFEYEESLCCAINDRNIFGVQFHPEKSHKYGMGILRRFALLTAPRD
jgi:glutamine amidotransferase